MNALLSETGFALEKESTVEVRVLYGAQAGSSLLLSPGDYLLGSSDDCTLILAGPHVAACHAVLRFDGHAAWIEPVKGIVRDMHGVEVIAEQELALGSPVDIGGVVIAVDRDDAPWPDPRTVLPAGDSPVSDTTEEAGKGDSADDEAMPVPVPVPAGGEAAMLAAASLASGSRRRPRPGRWLLVLFLILGLVAAAIALWIMPLKTAAPEKAVAAAVQSPRDAQPPAAALRVLKDYPDAVLSMKKEVAGWSVVGYVATVSQRRSLANALDAAAPAVRVDVLAEEELVQQIKSLLAGEDLDAYIKVDSATRGVARLSGAAASDEVIQRISQLVMANVPGVLEVQPDFLLPEQLRRKLKERIGAAGLAERLVMSTRGPELRLDGRLTQDETRRWEELLLRFGRDYGNVLPIRATIARLVPKPPVGVQVIVGGAMPYIVTQSGEHVNQGGSVDGHTLMSIKEGEVVFEGTQRIRIAR